MAKSKKKWHQRFTLQHFRHRLAHLDALPQLALLGLLSGLATGALMVLFLSSLNLISQTLLGTDVENYEDLPLAMRASAPMLGGLCLMLLMHFSKKHWRPQGIGFVIERFFFNQGRLPWQNGIHQFFTALIALASGFSAGREGPAVHMGATISSYIGEKFRLPNNSLRILVGCGSAAAIGASFHTPIAGVIFAMEVIMMEYTLVGFTPIILASVSGTALSQWMLGEASLLHSASVELSSLYELPWVAVSGIMMGGLAALFITICGKLSLYQQKPLALRFSIVALLTCISGIYFPTLLGTGFDLVNLSFTGQLSLGLLLFLAIAKLLLTATTFGLGVPVGIIGPLLVIGGLFGAAMGYMGAFFVETEVSDISIYAVIGMASMMAASLQAPLAALMALMELTNNSHIILPGMLGVVSAILTCRYFLPENTSIFHHLLALRGRDLAHPPLAQAMNRVGVTSIMENNYWHCDNQITLSQAKKIIQEKIQWMLITEVDSDDKILMPTAALANYLYLLGIEKKQTQVSESQTIILSEIPTEDRLTASAIQPQATLTEAYEQIADMRTDALYVINDRQEILGILTYRMIENYYQ